MIPQIFYITYNYNNLMVINMEWLLNWNWMDLFVITARLQYITYPHFAMLQYRATVLPNTQYPVYNTVPVLVLVYGRLDYEQNAIFLLYLFIFSCIQ